MVSSQGVNLFPVFKKMPDSTLPPIPLKISTLALIQSQNQWKNNILFWHQHGYKHTNIYMHLRPKYW